MAAPIATSAEGTPDDPGWRIHYLALKTGRWGDQQILSEEWLTMAETASSANPGYGFMNGFLNTGRDSIPAAPESAFSNPGAGTNLIYVDRESDLVIVARWIRREAIAGFVEKVLAAENSY